MRCQVGDRLEQRHDADSEFVGATAVVEERNSPTSRNSTATSSTSDTDSHLEMM